MNGRPADRDGAPDRARPRANRLRRRRGLREPDAGEGGRPGRRTRSGGAAAGTWSRTARSASPAATARSASCWRGRERRPPDGGDLLERPDGDRRDAGSRGPRPRRPRRPLGRRVRRHRRRDVDAAALDDGPSSRSRRSRRPRSRRSSTRSRRRSRPVRATSFGLASGPAAPRLRLRSTGARRRRSRSGR